jgi:hypothetical protein
VKYLVALLTGMSSGKQLRIVTGRRMEGYPGIGYVPRLE